MRKNFFIYLAIVLGFILAPVSTTAQEFSIATGNDTTFGGGGAYDGNNFLYALLGDATNKYGITAQFVSSSGILSGSRISLGITGSAPTLAFDGTNYLMVWTDPYPMFVFNDTDGIGNIYGQFISTSGNLVGTTFTIASAVNRKFGQGRGGLTFNDTTYLVTFLKGGNHIDYIYGQRISRSGTLIGSPIQISSHYAREQGIAFDGTNYLVAWCKVDHPATDKDIYGQFVSTSGTLVGQNFLIDGSQYASDNPVTMTFDGSRFLVMFPDEAADNKGWNLYGRFVTPSGTIAERFMICDSTTNPTYAVAAFDGTNYLITWMESAKKMRVKGRYFNPSGIPVSTAFTVFDTLGLKFPIGGVGGFVNGHYILGATRVDTNYTDGDVYGMFLTPLTTEVIINEAVASVQTFSLSQNYPNPFNPSTIIRYGLPNHAIVKIVITNTLGQELAVLANGEQEPGYHEVQWHANVASGIYFYRIDAVSTSDPNNRFVQVMKMLLLK
jgi:hypothetical protein